MAHKLFTKCFRPKAPHPSSTGPKHSIPKAPTQKPSAAPKSNQLKPQAKAKSSTRHIQGTTSFSRPGMEHQTCQNVKTRLSAIPDMKLAEGEGTESKPHGLTLQLLVFAKRLKRCGCVHGGALLLSLLNGRLRHLRATCGLEHAPSPLRYFNQTSVHTPPAGYVSFTHTHKHPHTQTHTHTQTQTLRHTDTRTHKHPHARTPARPHARTHTHTHTKISTHTHTKQKPSAHTHTQTQTRTHTQTHKHTNT